MADSVHQDLYEGFADRYDLFFDSVAAHDPEVVAFYRTLFARNGVHRVLDCACGTGRDLLLLLSLGCDVVGSDVSGSMLAQARENLAQHGLAVPLQCVDYRELPQHFTERFDAVVCLSSSILHMRDEAQVMRALGSMRDVLRKGGILVLTQGTTDKQWEERPRFILAVNRAHFSRLFVIDYIGQGARYNVLDLTHGDEASGFGLEVWSVDYPQMLLRDDYERLLAGAGFRPVEFYGNYRFEPYDRGLSDLLIVVAHNRE
jgi:SAM-dependent methyltransferase